MKYKITISYDGTKYGGWQVQPNTLTIQVLIQDALQTILRTPTPLTAAGRTDAGVHALGQVAHFSSDQTLDLHSLLYSLNGVLPRDIRIRELVPTSEDFHARYSAKSKIYHYHLHLTPVQPPFTYLYATHVRTSLDLKKLQEALPHFIGTHDFTSFASAGCGSKNPIKTLQRLEIVKEPEGIRLEFEGNGFLYKMVRNIVGTLLEIGKNKRSVSEIPFILAQKDRKLAGPTAPPKGLFLMKVNY